MCVIVASGPFVRILTLHSSCPRILALVLILPLSAVADQCPAPARGEQRAPHPLDETPADAPIEITSEGAEVTRSGDAVLKGRVEVRQGSRVIRAENAVYDARAQRFEVSGAVEYTDEQVRLRGEHATVSSEGGATIGAASFEMPQRPARGSASRVRLEPDGDLDLQDVRYTTCPAGNSDWVLKASELRVDQSSSTGSGRNVRLDFKGVPILYAPFISFPVGDQRKSGILFPSFGNSTRSGTEIGIPWYWNIAPNYDATLTGNWLSSRGPKLDTEFRYLTRSSEGQMLLEYLPDDDLTGTDRSLVRLIDTSDLTQRIRFTADAANASDEEWFEDFGLGIEGTSITYLQRVAQLEYLGREWRAIARAQNFQTIDDTIDPVDRPYTILPQLIVNGRLRDRAFGLGFDLDAELVNFDRGTGLTGQRFDLLPQLRMPLRGAGVYVEPAVGWRYTTYELDDAEPGADTSPSRSVPVVSVDTGLVFERLAGAGGNRLQTIEPRLYYLYVPHRDQADLPIFDSGVPDLNLIQLFRNNRFVGPDRLGDANQISIGLTTRLVDFSTGRQFLSATVGQAFYLQQPRVALPDEEPEEDDASDIVARLEIAAYKDWNVNMGLQWDPYDSSTEKGEIRLQYAPEHERVANVGYRFRRASLEQWDASFAWPVSRDWALYGRMVYSLLDDTTLERMAGVEYRACCWRLRLVSRRYVSNRTGESDSSIQVQLELNGLSSVGVPADAFLERSIRGYSARPYEP